MTILEDTTKQHQQTIQSLLDFVGAVGVPKERIQTIQGRVKIEEPLKLSPGVPFENALSATSALRSLQAYSKCYPYMDSCDLISKCASAWEALSARNHACKNYLNRRIMIMKTDPKADPDKLQSLEALKSDFGKKVIGMVVPFLTSLSISLIINLWYWYH